MTSPDLKTSDSPAGKRRLFSWRALRRIVIGLAWTATIIFLLYGVENWRCRRAWEQYRGAAEARGEHLDFSYFIPKPIPDDRNFAMAGSITATFITPFTVGRQNPSYNKVWDAFNKVWHDNFYRAWGHVKTPAGTGPGHFFHFTDLAAWEKALAAASAGMPADSQRIFPSVADPDPASQAAAAPGVLRGLQDCGPILDELRAASSRPEARYPVDYDVELPAVIALPHLTMLQFIVDRLWLRARAELALGRSDDAMNDLRLMDYLSDTPKNEPFLITGLVRCGLLAVQSEVIWEGLAEHRWSDAQLQEIQEWLLSQNFVADIQHELSAEQAGEVADVQYVAGNISPEIEHDLFERQERGISPDLEYYLAAMPGISSDLESFAAKASLVHLVELSHVLAGPDQQLGLGKLISIWLMPLGWCHLEQIDLCTRFQARFRSVFDAAAKRIFPRRLESNILADTPLPTGDVEALLQHRLISWHLLSQFDASLVRRYAGSQCLADEAAIACGLERYRLANGAYPTQLDALAPGFIPTLPHDALTGEPYRYRRDAADVFVLYSVGWDLKDDDGTPSAQPYGENGDWVW